MAGKVSKGNCYICGAALSKTAFKKHALTAHPCGDEDAQECVVLKVEGADDKNYWLYLDMPATSTLKMLDSFLREIWLECCGHLSAFYAAGIGEIGKNTRIGKFVDGFAMHYEYDFGSTTELLITAVGTSRRPKQRKAVRLLGRNEPPRFTCGKCGGEADFVCCECVWMDEDPLLCESCLEGHPHESVLPVVNSPRMGVCGYCGELDTYEFDPDKLKIK